MVHSPWNWCWRTSRGHWSGPVVNRVCKVCVVLKLMPQDCNHYSTTQQFRLYYSALRVLSEVRVMTQSNGGGEILLGEFAERRVKFCQISVPPTPPYKSHPGYVVTPWFRRPSISRPELHVVLGMQGTCHGVWIASTVQGGWFKGHVRCSQHTKLPQYSPLLLNLSCNTQKLHRNSR